MFRMINKYKYLGNLTQTPDVTHRKMVNLSGAHTVLG